MTLLGCAVCTALVLATALVLLRLLVSSGRLACWSTVDSVTGFDGIYRPRALLVARALGLCYCCAIFIWAEHRRFDITFYTIWSWILLTIYMALGTVLSWRRAAWGMVRRLLEPSRAAFLVNMLGDVVLGNALFLDLVLWILLLRRAPGWNDFGDLQGHLHAINFALALADRLLSGMRFSYYHFPFALLFLGTYGAFSLCQWEYAHTVNYFFLEPDRAGAELWYVSMGFVSLFFHFAVGHLCNLCLLSCAIRQGAGGHNGGRELAPAVTRRGCPEDVALQGVGGAR